MATLLQAARLRLRARDQGLALIAQKRESLELRWQSMKDMPPLVNLPPALRRRFHMVPGTPLMMRVSLAGTTEILPFLDQLLTAFQQLRKGSSLG